MNRSNSCVAFVPANTYIFMITFEDKRLSSKRQYELSQIERELQTNGFLGFVSKLSWPAYEDEELIAAIAAAASKRNPLITGIDQKAILDLSASKFFAAQSILCKVIPLLDTEPSELMELVQILVGKGGEDLAANQPNAAFREWCEVDASRSDEIIKLARDGSVLSQRFLVFALQAKGDAKEALECLEHSEDEQSSGILALSRMQLTKAQVRIALERSMKIALAADIEKCCGITRAIYDIAAKDHVIERNFLLSVLDKLFASTDPYVVHLAASLLSWHQSEMSEAETQRCLEKMITVDPENKGTIEEIDRVLAMLIEKGETLKASTTAHAIIDGSKGAIDSDSLESFFHKLAHGEKTQLGQVAAEWLSSGNFFPCVALSGAISEIDRKEPAFSVENIPLPETSIEQIFMCRKAIGFLFIHPMTAAAFSVAVLVRGLPEAKEYAMELIYDPLLLNYEGALRDWLEQFSNQNEVSRLYIKEALRRAEIVWSGCKEAREIVELEPSESARAVVNFKEMKEAERTRDAAGRRSIFSDLVTTQHLLYGDRSAFNVMTGEDELEQQTIPFSEITISSELPKGIFFDPIGLDMVLNEFRHEQLVNQ